MGFCVRRMRTQAACAGGTDLRGLGLPVLAPRGREQFEVCAAVPTAHEVLGHGRENRCSAHGRLYRARGNAGSSEYHARGSTRVVLRKGKWSGNAGKPQWISASRAWTRSRASSDRNLAASGRLNSGNGAPLHRIRGAGEDVTVMLNGSPTACRHAGAGAGCSCRTCRCGRWRAGSARVLSQIETLGSPHAPRRTRLEVGALVG